MRGTRIRLITIGIPNERKVFVPRVPCVGEFIEVEGEDCRFEVTEVVMVARTRSEDTTPIYATVFVAPAPHRWGIGG
jgi:hypothetical protein